MVGPEAAMNFDWDWVKEYNQITNTLNRHKWKNRRLGK